MNILPWLIIILGFLHSATGSCYFPGEIQGTWATQAAPDVADAPIAYSMVTIDADQISTWGQCHSKIDDNIILADRSGPHSAKCFRCFRLVVASVNVAALVSGGGLESCFASVDEALLSCPTTEKGAAHIVLYKLRQSWGDGGVQETQCPFSGVYFFTFEKGTKGHGDSRKMMCEQLTSEMSNCPFGFSFSLQYRDCTFSNPRGANWHCLGSWSGLDGQKYTAVLDMDVRDGDGRPKYKCGIYKEDKEGRIHLAFSRDSTCTNDLRNAEDGYERYVLYSAPASPLPNSVSEISCRFPSALRGEWHNTVIDKTSITFRDERNFDTLRMECVRDMGDAERYVVYARTDCGKWFYSCIHLKRRSANIIEIMTGTKSKESLDTELCDSRHFSSLSGWITRAKTNLELPTACPIVGIYKGELPDSPGYCAQLYSDCNRKDFMYYAIDECSNSEEIFERHSISRPHELKPRVFVSQKTPKIPHVPTRVRDVLPSEFHVGTVRLLPHSSEVDISHTAYETSLQGQTVLRVTKRKKRTPQQSNPFYKVNNPKTTTISFVWGSGNNHTTPVPRVDNERSDLRLPFMDHSHLRNLRGFGGGAFNNRRDNNDRESRGSSRRVSNYDRRNFGADVVNAGQIYSQPFSHNSGISLSQNPSDRITHHFHHNHRDNFDLNQRHDILNHRVSSNSRVPLSTSDGWHIPVSSTRARLPERNRFKSTWEPEVTTHQYPQRFYDESRRLNLRKPDHVKPFRDAVDNHKIRRPNAENEDVPITPENVRPLPLDNPRFDPLGFWPKSEVNERISNLTTWPTDTSNYFPDTDSRVETSLQGRATWVPLQSPSPAWAEVTDITLPASVPDERNRSKIKRKVTKEEREYQCLGEWEEEGHLYALTLRRDIHTYECFVGKISKNGVVYIKEAGTSCTRGVRPDDFGMKTVQKSECPGESEAFPLQNDTVLNDEGWRESRWRSRSKTVPPTRPSWVPSTTRPWKPITGRPRRRNSASSKSLTLPLLTSALMLIFSLKYFDM